MKIEKIRFSKSGFEMLLSPLEADVLETLWEFERALVREIHSKINKRKKVAVTSIAVILDRLHKKGLVSREHGMGKGGVHYLYTPTKSRKDLERHVINHTVDHLLERFGETADSYFEERFGKE